MIPLKMRDLKEEASSRSFAGVDRGRRGPGGCGGCFGKESLRIPPVKNVRGTLYYIVSNPAYRFCHIKNKNNNNRYYVKCARHSIG